MFWISSGSVVMSPFSFLILLIKILSPCPLVSLAKGLSIFLIFSNNQLLVWLILWIVVFVSTWLISALSLIISCCLLLLDEFASFSTRASRCAVRMLVYAHSSFFLEALWAMSFPLRTTFIVSHKFGYVVASFSLKFKKSLISFFISFLSKVLLSRVLFSVHVNVGFLWVMPLLKTSLTLWWSDRMHGVILIYFYLLRPVLWPIIWSILEEVPWGAEKKVYPRQMLCSH